MRVNEVRNYNCNNTYNQTFGAVITQKDLELLLKSANETGNVIQDFYQAAAVRRAVDKSKQYAKPVSMMPEVYTLLEQVKKFPDSVVSFICERLSSGQNIIKVIGSDKKVLGTGGSPLQALDNAFVWRLNRHVEYAPEYWNHKMPERIFNENRTKNLNATEQDVRNIFKPD
ncbi:hypothetical protein IKP85_04530 [bacterium]|nr:hypothetical protein [bacterium]